MAASTSDFRRTSRSPNKEEVCTQRCSARCRKGIRVNALAPGYFESEMTDQFEGDYVARTVIPRTLHGRLGRAEELNTALIFLASDASSYVTGITLPVDGGMLAT